MTWRILKEAVYEFTEIFNILEEGENSGIDVVWPEKKCFPIQWPKFKEMNEKVQENGDTLFSGLNFVHSEIFDVER